MANQHGELKRAILAELAADPSRDDFDIGLQVRCGPAYVQSLRSKHGFPKPDRTPHPLWQQLPECGSERQLTAEEHETIHRAILERARICRVYEEEP